jgi:hypothetical protein
MVTVYSLLIVQWEVVAGPPRAVRFVKSSPYSTWAPEGSSLSETKTILDYIAEQPKGQQDALYELARKGLLTLAIMAEVKLHAPPLPSA